MKIIVFGGPTISRREVGNILQAEYLPPARHSDIISVVRNRRPDVIVIFDGDLGLQQTVWHYEIIEALNRGVKVYGASGLGALRAAELDGFGMIGIGRIFALYRDKVIEADDEVFQRYEKQGEEYISLSLPMVNLRASFSRALSEGLISAGEQQVLLRASQALYFEDRSCENIVVNLQKDGIDPPCIEKLEKIVQEHYLDLKKEDALETLRIVSRLSPREVQKAHVSENKYDLFFYAMYDRDRKVEGENLEIPLYILSNYVSLRHPQIDELNSNALNRELSLLFAEVMNIEPLPREVARERFRFKKRFGLREEQSFKDWLKRNDMEEEEFNALMADQAKIRKAQSWYAIRLGFSKNTKYLLNALKLSGAYSEWKGKCEDFHLEVQQSYPQVIKCLEEQDRETLLRRFFSGEKRSWNLPAELFAEEILMSLDTLDLELAKDSVVKEKLAAEIADCFSPTKEKPNT
jgi:hypothetical protein